MGNSCCNTQRTGLDGETTTKSSLAKRRVFIQELSSEKPERSKDSSHQSHTSPFLHTSAAPETTPNPHSPPIDKVIPTKLENKLSPDAEQILQTLKIYQQSPNATTKDLPKLGPYRYRKTGETYRGQYRHGKREGHGILIGTDGSIYEGNFENDLKNGKGRMIKFDGSYYVGGWVGGKPHGDGKFDSKFKFGYEGDWVNGKMEGKGKKVNHFEGTVYEGCFLAGKEHGFGVLKWENGDVFEGMFVAGVRDGNGKIIR
jgi:hypothetical protein